VGDGITVVDEGDGEYLPVNTNDGSTVHARFQGQ